MNRVDNVEKEKWFTLRTEVSQRQTRSAADPMRLEQGRARTELRRTVFSMRTVEKWNSLPIELRSSKSLGQFKNRLKHHRRRMDPGIGQ